MDDESSAVLPAVPETPAPQAGGFWYCEKCTKLIHPPGSAGVVVDDKHFCPGCAPASEKVEAARPPARSSKASIPLPVPASASARSTKPALKPASGAARTPEAPAPAVSGNHNKRMIAIGIAVAGLSLFLIGLIVSSGPTDESVGQSSRIVTLDTNAPKPEPKPEAAPQKPPAPEAPRTFKVPGEGDAGLERTPPVVTPIPEPPPQKPVAVQQPADDGQSAFKASLADAQKLSDAEDYSAALDLLARAKALHEAKPWWEQKKAEFAAAEKRIQEQLSEALNEAEDIRAQAAKSDKPEFLDKIEAIWKKRTGSLASDTGWSAMDIVSMEATSGTVLTRLDDGSILASGNSPEHDFYTVAMQTRLSGITAFRLDALTHESLPQGGPGRAGNFVLAEFKVQAASGNEAIKPVSLVRARADFCQDAFAAEQMLDGNLNTGWAVQPHIGKPHTAIFDLAAPLIGPGGLRLTFTLDSRVPWGKHTLGRFRISATTAKTPPGPDVSAPVGLPAPPAGDQRLAQAARQILKAVADSRIRMAEQLRQKRTAEILSKLDSAEKLLKQRPRIIDPLKKFLDEADAVIALDAELIEKFAERSGGLRYDTNALRDGELALYKAQVKTMGSAADILYTFDDAAEFSAWYFDNPGNCGNAEHDLAKRMVLLRCIGGHNWDGKDRRNTPVLRLPFHFKADNWMIEADVELVSDGNKGNKPDFGILVWDGSTSVMRLTIQENARGMNVHLSGSNPARENFWVKAVQLNGKIREKTHLQMTCTQGVVTATATNAAGQSVKIGKETLGFEPRFTGLVIRSNDGGDNVQIAVRSFHIQGVPHSERLKEIREVQRAVAARDAKGELTRRAAAAKLIQDGRFTPLSLEKAATRPSTKRMFQGAGDEERLLFPSYGLQTAHGVPFVVADPRGDTANNIILLHSSQGQISATMPKSAVVACNSTASTIHLLGCVSGWGFPVSNAKTVSLIVRLQYEDGKSEDHPLHNGVHIADYIRQVEVPESKFAFKCGEQQVRYLALKVGRPDVPIKNIEFVKGEDKTAPVIAAVTLDKQFLNPTPASAPKTVTDGKIGRALACRVREDFIEAAHHIDYDPAQFTVEAWIYMDSWPDGGEKRRWIVNKNAHEGQAGHYGLIISDKCAGAYLNIDKTYQAVSPEVLKLGQWQHLAMTFDEKTLKVYLDGAVVASTEVNKARSPGTMPFAIGRRQDGHVSFNGLIDEVRVYRRPLSDAEIKLRIQEPQKVSQEGLTGYWNFD
ncbi:MAG TPA: LamG-like jellyroll fold domain-containing protein [Planctomycetota bacterium]|nr:LamG-like jellyroll fold domain-containing protein [Planctomycetota bacterium]